MNPALLRKIALNEWRETRDTLWKYCRLVGAIREVLSKPLPHSLHTNLLISRSGFTTSVLFKDLAIANKTFEVTLDLSHKRLRITSNYREPLYVTLTGQSLNALCDETCSLLSDIGVKPPLERPSFIEGTRGKFDTEPLKVYWRTAAAVSRILKEIKKDLRGETSPVQLRPDDFSLNLNWFGKSVSLVSEFSAEQVEFGFSTGDENIDEAYFYIYSFPESTILEEFTKPVSFIRTRGNLKMAVLPLSKMKSSKVPEITVKNFFKRIKPLFKHGDN
jgi:hypothetical protein